MKASDKMRLRMQDHGTHGSMLPRLSQFSADEFDTTKEFDDFHKGFDNEDLNLVRGNAFIAGDNRVGEFPGKFFI